MWHSQANKQNKHEWGLVFVQDLRAINSIGIPQYPVLPPLHILLTSIPMESKLFIVTDFCSTFFSLPVDPESQFLFSFTWEGQ